MIKYKKGQIVPRWSNIKANDRKAQHCIKFGADVSFEGGVWYLESDGPLVYLKHQAHRMMKNGTIKTVGVTAIDIHINGGRVTSEQALVCTIS